MTLLLAIISVFLLISVCGDVCVIFIAVLYGVSSICKVASNMLYVCTCSCLFEKWCIIPCKNEEHRYTGYTRLYFQNKVLRHRWQSVCKLSCFHRSVVSTAGLGRLSHNRAIGWGWSFMDKDEDICALLTWIASKWPKKGIRKRISDNSYHKLHLINQSIRMQRGPQVISRVFCALLVVSVIIQCSAVITRSIFSQIFTKDGWAIACILWIQHLIDILPQLLQSFMQYLTIPHRFITVIDCIKVCWDAWFTLTRHIRV